MQKLMSTRSGTILVGLVAAGLAAAVLVVYLVQYRNSVRHSAQPVSVLVAKQVIPKNTSGDVIGTKSLYQVTRIPAGQVVSGALTDPGALSGKVTNTTIVTGQQLTESDFSSASANAVVTKLSGYQRAMAVPLNNSAGLIGNVEVGDHVDVIAGFQVQPVNKYGQPLGSGQAHPVVVTLIQDAPVLAVPTNASSTVGATQNSAVTIGVTDQQAAKLGFATMNGTVWLALRSQVGSRAHTPSLVNIISELYGTKILTKVQR